jgi:hypothetical protein
MRSARARHRHTNNVILLFRHQHYGVSLVLELLAEKPRVAFVGVRARLEEAFLIEVVSGCA